jgi:hypothetical protein
MNYRGKPIHEMTRMDLLMIIDELAQQLEQEYAEKRHYLRDPAFSDYMLGIRYEYVENGLYKRTVIT